jgi:segregation and condensation protein B
MNTEKYKPIVDALIFASDCPVSIQKIRQIIDDVSNEQLSAKDILEIIEEINNDNKSHNRGFYLQEVAGGFQFRTRPNYASWIKKLKKSKAFRLTQPTMETLAIVAYKQPIIRAEVDKIRGVDSGGVIKNLLDRNLIKIAGRKNIPGRPFMFGTTARFLEVFGLEKLSDLPTLKEFESMDESMLPSILSKTIQGNIVAVSDIQNEDISNEENYDNT